MGIPELTGRRAALIIGGVSTALLLGALGFQYLGGLAPCPLCMLQRYWHLMIVAAVGLYIALPRRLTAAFGVLMSFCAAAVAFFHAGVELKWWEGPQGCSGVAENMTAMGGAALLSLDSVAPIVKCTEVAWSFVGLSMAGWNGVITLLVASLWVICWRRCS
ncbi:disulfide bond formation protein B [Sulfitobacter sp. 1A13353]|uniref:disulfide bond formation protein B n=1 Tax=Sulfitobacter sp. 1A13353 TaxID=3368568 RepID=UPI003746D4BA